MDYEAFVLDSIAYLANSAKITEPPRRRLPGFIDLDVYAAIIQTSTNEYVFFSFSIADMAFNRNSSTKVCSPALHCKKWIK